MNLYLVLLALFISDWMVPCDKFVMLILYDSKMNVYAQCDCICGQDLILDLLELSLESMLKASILLS